MSALSTIRDAIIARLGEATTIEALIKPIDYFELSQGLSQSDVIMVSISSGDYSANLTLNRLRELKVTIDLYLLKKDLRYEDPILEWVDAIASALIDYDLSQTDPTLKRAGQSRVTALEPERIERQGRDEDKVQFGYVSRFSVIYYV